MPKLPPGTRCPLCDQLMIAGWTVVPAETPEPEQVCRECVLRTPTERAALRRGRQRGGGDVNGSAG